MDQDTDIIFFSLSRYDDPISFVGFSLAKELSKRSRVFFIEQPFTWKDYWQNSGDDQIQKRKNAWKGGSNKYLREVSFPASMTYIVPPRMLPMNFLPAGVLYEACSNFNNRLLFNQLREIIRENKVSKFIFVNCFNPFYMDRFPGDIKPLIRAYYSVDDISQVEYTRKHGLKKEEFIIKSFDCSFNTGVQLQKKSARLNRHSFYLPNASDYALFSTAANEHLTKPSELEGLEGRKLIGFTGSVEYRTDFQLLKEMVEFHSDKFFVVVGPVYAPEIEELGFSRMNNVRFIGPKPHKELPAYSQYMDVMILPYKLSVLTQSIYPLKLNEYLGAGKPVVSTSFSDDIRSFRDVVYLANDSMHFNSLIDEAIEENNEILIEKRMARARENTWEARADQFWANINSLGIS